MKINDANRPKDITSDAIWEIYKRLCEMEKRYVFYHNTQGCRSERKRFLCYVESIGIGADETEYDDRDPMGIPMPVRKLEWVYLSLVTMKNGKLCHWNTSRKPGVKSKFVMMSENCPGDFFEVNTKFEKELSRVIFCYNAVGAMEYHASTHKESLLVFLEFLNSTCDLANRDFGFKRRSEPKVSFAPKFYVEKECVSMFWEIPNALWARNPSDVNWYILEY